MNDLNRRVLLATGAVLLPAALATAACSRESDGKGEAGEREEGGGEEEVTANEDLMREHGVLRRILVLYREVAPRIETNAAGVDVAAIATAATLFRDFGEQYHEKMLEEQYIFPAVRKAGGQVAALPDILLAQHARGREITAYVLDQTKGGRIATGQAASLAKAMIGFSRMYEAHSAREDTIVFPAFKKAFSKDQFKELGEKFEEIEKKQFGADGFDMAVDKVAQAEQALGIADLASFTPPPPAA